MENKNTTDVMQLFVVMASSIFGSSAASVVGPYLLIIFAAITGAAWSLGRYEFKSKWSAFFYFLRVAFTAILLTVGISKLVGLYMASEQTDWLIAPVALIIGLIGNEWNQIFLWCFNAVTQLANKLLKKKLDE